jgi:hypothetical protein
LPGAPAFFARFDQFNGEQLQEQPAADMCWPMSWLYFARVATLPDYQ